MWQRIILCIEERIILLITQNGAFIITDSKTNEKKVIDDEYLNTIFKQMHWSARCLVSLTIT